MGYRLGRYRCRDIASMAKKYPDMVEQLKEIDGKEYKYAKGVRRNIEIKKLCKEKGIYNYDELIDYLKENRPEWYDELRKSAMSEMYLKLWFDDRDYQKRLTQARKEVKGDRPNNRKAKPVVCLDNGMEFSSINQAAAWINHRRTHDISDCCYGIISSVKGFHFRFKDDLETSEN